MHVDCEEGPKAGTVPSTLGPRFAYRGKCAAVGKGHGDSPWFWTDA